MEEMTARVVLCLAVVREAHTIVRICLHYISSFSCLMMRCLLVGVGQVSLEELGHTEGTNAVRSENLKIIIIKKLSRYCSLKFGAQNRFLAIFPSNRGVHLRVNKSSGIRMRAHA